MDEVRQDARAPEGEADSARLREDARTLARLRGEPAQMIPLYDHESEKWLIGALLTDAEVQKQLPTLPADLMHDPLNEKILSCMRRLQERREPSSR